MKKLPLLTAVAAGYVLGSRAGRQRYEQIASGARAVMRNPRVQAASTQAKGKVAEQASAVKDAAAEKAREAASSVASTVSEKVHRGEGGSHAAGTWPSDSSAPTG